MHLVEVDVVGAEPAQASLTCFDKVVARPGPMFRGLEWRRPLGRDHDVTSTVAERLAQPLLARSVARRGVEQVEAGVERSRDDGPRLVLVDAKAEVVASDADDRDVQPGRPELAERHVAHAQTLRREDVEEASRDRSEMAGVERVEPLASALFDTDQPRGDETLQMSGRRRP